jgi:hypothetical protein
VSTRRTRSNASSTDRIPRAASRSPTPVRSRQSVARFLKSAQEPFQRDGWDGTTTRKIADAAGLSGCAVYAYFHDREAITCKRGSTGMAGIRTAIVAVDPPRPGRLGADPPEGVDPAYRLLLEDHVDLAIEGDASAHRSRFDG